MIKKISVLGILLFVAFFAFSQVSTTKSNSGSGKTGSNSGKATATVTKKTSTSTSTTTSSTPAKASTSTTNVSSDFQIDHFIIGGGIAAGALISTNVVNTGALINGGLDFMIQFKHHRLGIGGNKTIMLTLENLGTVIGTLGKNNCNLSKAYLIYEWTLFKRSPINFTAGLKLGSFDAGNIEDTTKTPFFASAGIGFEIGHPRFFLYVKPEIGYNSYNSGSWKKDIYALVAVGFRWKSKRLDKYNLE